MKILIGNVSSSSLLNLQIQPNPIQNFMHVDIFLKFIQKGKRLRIANKTLKDKVEKLTKSDLKTYYKSAVSKAMCYWQKNRHIDQQNRRRSRNRPTQMW